ncbi:hypothetical protein DH86_00003313 [Scytalidium sp. 3C]|nr:hypothetical protein DH86_00003313 [Scytalidium sp. 3C]
MTTPEILASDCDPHSDPYSILDPVHIKGKVDVYSCGAILLALLDGVLPYNGNMVMTLFSQFHATEHYTHMMNTPLSRTLTIQHRNTSWGTRDLLLKLLEVNPKSRYTVLQAVRHPWCCSVSLESAVRFAVQCGE